MSSEVPPTQSRTVVRTDITDPVEKARAELKAALAAIEIKTNVPRRLADKLDETGVKMRRLQQRNPEAVVALAVAAAAVVGGAVWAITRALSR
ncbi:hypothetical protein [Microbacterium sp. C7(2022)]|uniref:hypothetical protein n=1 Tax=Microbacterium sp. C7(2022) TaxID=2992759 RepID=UPI00237A2D95|nr:hypothetical protein [Microbacterium sp. C7(2022)]MDE0546542.1 hypothetical protein [Microbacterium sp. C7(2022)]